MNTNKIAWTNVVSYGNTEGVLPFIHQVFGLINQVDVVILCTNENSAIENPEIAKWIPHLKDDNGKWYPIKDRVGLDNAKRAGVFAYNDVQMQKMDNVDALYNPPERSEKVIPLGNVTRLDLPVDQVLEEAKGECPEGVVILGFDKNGMEYFASSIADGGTVNWLLDRCKKNLLQTVDDILEDEFGPR